MKRKLVRFGALGASAAVVAGGLVLGAGAASAATVIGTLSISPANGTVTTGFNVTTSAGCPANDSAVAATIVLHGDANPADVLQLIGTNNLGISHTGPFTQPIGDTLFGLAAGPPAVALNPGQYDIKFTCLIDGNQDPSASDGEFDGKIFLTGTPAQGALQPYQGAADSATSTTTLVASPPATAIPGANVTLTATVAAPAPGTKTGTVQFKDGTTNLGGPVTVTGGTATFSSTNLTTATHSFTAIYNGDVETLPSTSAAVPYSIHAPATPTTTALSAPASIGQFSPATFNVTTTPATTPGSVTLTEGGTTIGTGTVANGAGTVTATFATQGSHTVVANFTPTDPTFAPSSSSPVTVSVGPSTGVSTSESLETTVAAGSLTISVASSAKVVLPTPVLDPNAGVLVTTGQINPVTVTDTRSGAPGFTVSGIVSDFTDGAATPHLINGFDLGWQPFILDAPANMHIVAGPQVNPALGVLPGVTPTDPTLGLKSLRTLATNPAGGLGTTHLSANLALDVPTSTSAATYDAILTLTAI
jgi:hypothetical protein